MAARPLRVAIALLLATAACGPLSHAAVRPDLLDPATGRASPPLPATAPERMRVAVYGDSQGNSAAHQAVVAAILAEKPDLVLFAGDAIDHLPAGHMPDWGGWQYAVPIWPQYVRGLRLGVAAHRRPLPGRRPRDPARRRGASPEAARSQRLARGHGSAPRGGHPGARRSREPRPVPPSSTRRSSRRIFSPPGGLELPPDGFWYEVDRGGWRFLVLDTGTDMFGDRDPMPEGGPQLTWLEERLSDADRLRPPVHRPPPRPALRVGEGGARRAPWVERRVVKDILDRHPVALVLSGHIHAYERIVRPGFEGRPVNFVVSGGGGGRFFRVADRRVEGSVLFVEDVRHFVLLELGPDGLSGRALPVKVPGEEWRNPPSPLDVFQGTLR